MPLAVIKENTIRQFLTTKCAGNTHDGQHVPIYQQDGSYTETYFAFPTEDGHCQIDDVIDGNWNDVYESRLYCRYCHDVDPVHLGFNESWETY